MNQSLKVVLVRFGVDPKVPWPLLAVAVLGVTAIGMRRAFTAGWPAWTLSLNALGTLLITPVSYSHPLGVDRPDPADRRRVRLAHGRQAHQRKLPSKAPQLSRFTLRSVGPRIHDGVG
jgi:hypothetical protein